MHNRQHPHGHCAAVGVSCCQSGAGGRHASTAAPSCHERVPHLFRHALACHSLHRSNCISLQRPLLPWHLLCILPCSCSAKQFGTCSLQLVLIWLLMWVAGVENMASAAWNIRLQCVQLLQHLSVAQSSGGPTKASLFWADFLAGPPMLMLQCG